MASLSKKRPAAAMSRYDKLVLGGIVAIGILLTYRIVATSRETIALITAPSLDIVEYRPPPPPADVLKPGDAITRAINAPLSSKAHYDLGMARYAVKDYAGAALEFRTAIHLSPDGVSKEAYFYLAFTLEALDNPQEAYFLAKHLLTMPLTRSEKSRAELMLGLRDLDAHHEASAEGRFKASLAANPNMGGAMYGMAVIEHRRGNDRRAIPYLKGAIKFATAGQSAAASHHALGLVYEGQGRVAEAKREFVLALQSDAGYTPAIDDQTYINKKFPGP